jgi:hypothetical protein
MIHVFRTKEETLFAVLIGGLEHERQPTDACNLKVY